jgi:sugar/nucleoside kinase (ribokinase family)
MRPVNVLAVGAAHLDRRARSLVPFRNGASNPGVVTETIGGSVLNAALAMRRLGAEVHLCSARGGDPAGERVEETLESAGIADHSFVWLDRATATYTAILDDRGDLVAGIADMAIYDLLGRRVLRQRQFRAAAAECDALMLDANLSEVASGGLLERFEGRPTAAIAVSPAKAVRLAPHLGKLSVIFLSRAEAAALVEMTAATDVVRLAQLLGEMGAVRAVITDGPQEAAILEAGSVRLQAPPAVASLRDVTGAGDTLAGVAFRAYVGGMPFDRAVRLGMAAASSRISAEPQDDGSFVETIASIAETMAPQRVADPL